MEKHDRIENARELLELIDNDLWPVATDAQKKRLCLVLAVMAALGSPEPIIEFYAARSRAIDQTISRRRYVLHGDALFPVEDQRSENHQVIGGKN